MNETTCTGWGEPNSAIRILLVRGIIAELKGHLGPDVERDRAEMISGDSARLDDLEALLESWRNERCL